MQKITVDSIPNHSIQYLDHIPNQEEKGQLEAAKGVYSVPIERPLIHSELNQLVGEFSSFQAFAAFPLEIPKSSVEVFSSKMIPGIDLTALLSRLEQAEIKDFNEQEELERLLTCFTWLEQMESLYQVILAHLRRLQKG